MVKKSLRLLMVPEMPENQPPENDSKTLPLSEDLRGRGGVDSTPTLSEVNSLVVISGQTESGRKYLVTTSREIWQQEVDAGRVVFSSGEIQRLHSVACGADRGDLLLDIKEIFPGAYVSASRQV